MAHYSQLPLYNTIFSLLKEWYIRVPKFSKQYKYLLGEKLIECCVESLVRIHAISEDKESSMRLQYIKEIEQYCGSLLVYTRIAHEYNQLGKKDAYFSLSEKILHSVDQARQWKRFLEKNVTP